MSDHDKSIKAAKLATPKVYQSSAAEWDRQRNRSLMERQWLDRFAQSLAPSGHVLDLGCGAGDPVSDYFLTRGFKLTGIDYARAMIDIAQSRFPQGRWMVQDMRNLQLGDVFDGIISWDGLFHLTVAEQRELVPQFGDRLNPDGRLLFTIGPQEGEVTGTVAGQTVYHASLDPEEYRSILANTGFDAIMIEIEDPECGGHSVVLARK